MKKSLAVLAALTLTCLEAPGALPTTDLTLHATLLPNSEYQITVDVSTNAVSSLLALLTGSGTDPVQILDGSGNVIGFISLQDLLDRLLAATGTLTDQLTMVVKTAGTAVVDPVLRTIDSPLLQITNPAVSPIRIDQAPSVNITHRDRRQAVLRLRGTASDDSKVQRVVVTTNGKTRRANGTTKWNVRTQLHPGRNRLVVQAYDDSQRVSPARRLTVNVR